MPIDVNKLETEGKDVTVVRNSNVQDSVLAFLKKNKKQAYTQKELGVELGMKPQQARQCCMALLKKDMVVRKAVDVPTESGKTQNQIHWRFSK